MAKSDQGQDFAIITLSFQAPKTSGNGPDGLDSVNGHRNWWNLVSASRRFDMNEELPRGAIGISFGVSGSSYDVFVEVAGGQSGVVPLIGYAGGIIHPIKVSKVVSTEGHRTGAPNIVIWY